MNIRPFGIIGLVFAPVLFAQNTFVVMENNIPQTVRAIQSGRPQVGSDGNLRIVSGLNASLVKAAAYGQAFITFDKFGIGLSPSQHSSYNADMDNELNLTGRIRSDTSLVRCFMVVEIAGATSQTVFAELPDLTVGKDEDLDVSFPAGADAIDKNSHITVHVFSNGVELLHSLMPADFLAVQRKKAQAASRLMANQPDRPLAPLKQTAPVYPDELRALNLAGNAKILCRVSAEGDIVEAQIAESSHPSFGTAAVAAARQWKFQPAVRNHQYVESTVVIPFAFAAPSAASEVESPPAAATDSYPPPITPPPAPAPENSTPAADSTVTQPNPVETAGPPADQPDRLAIPINQPAAAYPDALVSENVAGYAKVSCQVSAQGEVGNPQIVEASHPAFGIAAFSAALQWTFQPAVRNHQYVESTVVIPFNFSPPGVTVSTETPPPPAAVAVEAPPAAPPTASAAVDLTALSPDDADAQQRKAEVLLYLHDHPDSEATPVNPIAPSYPAQLKPDGSSGSVRISCRVNVNGDVTGARIVETSNPLFGSAALTATRMSRFLPAIKSHQFSASTVVLTFEFTAASPVAASGNPALSPDDIADQQKLAEVLLYLRDQPDSDATPINPIAPSYPAQLKPGGGSGSARISCRITADGDATGARIVEASNPLFGSAALTAIRMSRFIPAIKDHQFVDSTVTIPVNFPAPGR